MPPTVRWIGPRDGRIAYEVSGGGTRGSDIWTMAADGSDNKQIAFGLGANANLTVSPDGRYVVFVSGRAGGTNVWRMNLDGSDVKQLTTGMRDTMPVVTPDSQSVIYCSWID